MYGLRASASDGCRCCPGGERSLVALAYLFAVFRSRPSPFYVLDEVEAALDDVNLQRFLDLVADFRREAQPHHREPSATHDGSCRRVVRRLDAAGWLQRRRVGTTGASGGADRRLTGREMGMRMWRAR